MDNPTGISSSDHDILIEVKTTLGFLVTGLSDFKRSIELDNKRRDDKIDALATSVRALEEWKWKQHGLLLLITSALSAAIAAGVSKFMGH